MLPGFVAMVSILPREGFAARARRVLRASVGRWAVQRLLVLRVSIARGVERGRVLLPERHLRPRRVLEEREPALAGDLHLRRQDLPARLLDPLHVVVDGVHEDVVEDALRPIAGLQASDAAGRSARRFEERVLHPGDRGELPSEQVPVELLDLLRLLHVELHVHDASGLRSLRAYDVLPEGTRDGRGGYLRLRSWGERRGPGHS